MNRVRSVDQSCVSCDHVLDGRIDSHWARRRRNKVHRWLQAGFNLKKLRGHFREERVWNNEQETHGRAAGYDRVSNNFAKNMTEWPGFRRLYWTGAFLCSLAFVVLCSEDGIASRLSPPPVGGIFGGMGAAMTSVYVMVAKWIFVVVGPLVLLTPVLLRLRWWYAWAGFVFIGVFLAMEGKTVCGFPEQLFKDCDDATALGGVGFVLMAPVFGIIQWRFRRVRKIEPKPEEKDWSNRW